MDMLQAMALRDEFLERVQAIAHRLAEERPLTKLLSGWFRRAVGRPPPPLMISLGVSLGPSSEKCGISVRSTAPLDLLETSFLRDLRARAAWIDVLIIGRVTAEQASAAKGPMSLPLRIGSSIGHPKAGPGTLGAFVRDRATRAVGIVSNNHVIAAFNNGVSGDKTNFHYMQNDVRQTVRVGELKRFVRLNEQLNEVDAAFALLDNPPEDPRDVASRIRLNGNSIVLHAQTEVCKFGHATGFTRGMASSVGQETVKVEINGLVRSFHNQIEVKSTGAEPFSEKGDSGSLVVTPNGEAVGLLFGGALAADNQTKLSYANPIKVVLDVLKVDLLV